MATKHSRPPWWRTITTHAWQVTVGVLVVLAAFLLFVDSRESEEGEQVANDNLTATAARGQTLADQILAACQTGSIPTEYSNACNTAADVSAEPVVVVPGTPGERGATGAAGLRGEKGDGGAKGEKGDKGDTGDRGDDGQAGQDGQDGEPGQDGADGVDGQPGQDGQDGADGDPGCLPGTQPEPFVYPDGRSGSRCVEPEAEPEAP